MPTTKRDHMKTAYSRKLQIATLPSIQYLQQAAQRALENVPENLKNDAQNIQIIVENYADQITLGSLHIKDKYELLGLYRGTPIPVKTIFTDSSLPDIIYLYRCPLVRYSIDNNEILDTLIQQVMIHELGHHFGCSYTKK
jgi:predicted Zn-dependent protease with MMP-like domain